MRGLNKRIAVPLCAWICTDAGMGWGGGSGTRSRLSHNRTHVRIRRPASREGREEVNSPTSSPQHRAQIPCQGLWTRKPHLNRDSKERSEGMGPAGIHSKGGPGGGHSLCKGPGASRGPAHWRNSEEARVAGAERARGREGGGESGEGTGGQFRQGLVATGRTWDFHVLIDPRGGRGGGARAWPRGQGRVFRRRRC